MKLVLYIMILLRNDSNGCTAVVYLGEHGNMVFISLNITHNLFPQVHHTTFPHYLKQTQSIH